MSSPTNGILGATDHAGSVDVDPIRGQIAGHVAIATPELLKSLAEIKGQAQFLLYLADHIEEALEQLGGEADHCHASFLCKILGMYSSQLESKHQGLGERIAEACQEVYVTVREREIA